MAERGRGPRERSYRGPRDQARTHILLKRLQHGQHPQIRSALTTPSAPTATGGRRSAEVRRVQAAILVPIQCSRSRAASLGELVVGGELRRRIRARELGADGLYMMARSG